MHMHMKFVHKTSSKSTLRKGQFFTALSGLSSWTFSIFGGNAEEEQQKADGKKSKLEGKAERKKMGEKDYK